MNGQAFAALTDLLFADGVLLEMYDDAAVRMSPETASVLSEAIEDHTRHHSSLTEALEGAEMQIAEPSEDMQLLMEEHRHRVRAARDERDVLDALVLAERLNAMLYERAEQEELPEELSEVIIRQHADERLHVELIAERRPHVPSLPEHSVSCITGLTDDINPDDFD